MDLGEDILFFESTSRSTQLVFDHGQKFPVDGGSRSGVRKDMGTGFERPPGVGVTKTRAFRRLPRVRLDADGVSVGAILHFHIHLHARFVCELAWVVEAVDEEIHQLDRELGLPRDFKR